jgi:ABC-2 type transport system ATP-binding protein
MNASSEKRSAVEFRSVSKWYGHVIGVNDFSLQFAPGATGLLGPNGAGKSTLLQLATGQLRPSQGDVRVLGHRPWNNAALNRLIGLCPEQDAFFEWMTGREFLTACALLAGLGRRGAKGAAQRALEQVRMTEHAHRAVRGYSKGMRQRTKLAQALVHDPQVLFLDEPLSGTDPVARRELVDLIIELGKSGRTIVVSSHVLHEIEAITRQVVLMNRGRLVAFGDVRQVRDLIDAHPHRIVLKCPDSRALAAKLVRFDDVVGVEVRRHDGAIVIAPHDLEDPAREVPPRLSRYVPLSAIGALLRITADRQLRGRKLLVLCLLFSLPILFAVLARRYQDPYRTADAEKSLIFVLIPQALLPLAALIFASGMVQDDVEEQTLTYLLIRPIPRWMIYLVKLAGTWLVIGLLSSFFTAAALAVVYWRTGELTTGALFQRAAIFAGILSLSLLAYTAIFGLLGILLRRSLLLGISYIMVFEGIAANIDFIFRRATVMYHVRVLSIRWLGLPGMDWSIDPATAPTAATCLITLLAIGAVPALVGAFYFSVREFRVKTPEGT